MIQDCKTEGASVQEIENDQQHDESTLLELEKINLKIAVLQGLSAINDRNINNYLAEIDNINTSAEPIQAKESLENIIKHVDMYSKFISHPDMMSDFLTDPSIESADSNLRRILRRIRELVGG